MTWEGTLNSARLEVSAEAIELIAAYFSPFKEYLNLIVRSLALSLDFAYIFEVILMKRFQEMFQEAGRPSEVLPNFFDTAFFGSCQDLLISDHARPMPQIRCGRSGRGLEDTHIDNKAWPFRLENMEQHNSIYIKPPLRAASSDVLFVGNVHINQSFFRYAFRLTARNFAKTPCTIGDIRNECDKFDAIFKNSDKNENHLNILIICATEYEVGLQARFGGKKFFTLHDISPWKYIDEVILLDLTSWENRAQFFGFDHEDPLKAAIEGVISKHRPL